MVPSLEKFRRDQQELEAERQRAKVELARREAESRKQQQEFDWSAFWGMVDKRIATVIDARDIFTENQRDVLSTAVNDARDATRGEISKAIDDL
jgi:hypothetical protein